MMTFFRMGRIIKSQKLIHKSVINYLSQPNISPTLVLERGAKRVNK